MTDAEIRDKMREYLREVSDHNLSDDENFFQEGVIDSFGVVSFLTYLEEIFMIEFEPDDITEEFFTLNTICDFIKKNMQVSRF